MDKRLERILPRVQKPARYVGGEFNAIMKDKSKVDTRVAFCFPDTYEIGMSNLGMRILYGVMNNIEGVWCERCFAPWGDMEQEMRNANIPLYALESFDPIKDFDIIAFSIGYEMAFPAMVDMLDLAGVPLHASERTALTPLVVAGGTAMYNCEPIADFIDLALIGEGEEMDVELIELHRQARREGWSKHEFLVCAAQIPGVYVPSLYDVVYNDDGSLEGYSYPNRPAHIFINPKIIAEAPAEYFWAGVGDALSKQPEVEYATSAGNLEHTAGLGLALAHTCSEPLFTYGVQGLEDVRQNLSTEAVKQIALDIVVNTGYVSNLTNQNDYYYNSSVAHAFYNATCSIPREGTYLHGEVVSLGVLVLFAYTGDTENLERYSAFNKQMGLPVTLEQVGLSESDIPALCEYAHTTNEWKQGNPEPFTDEKFAAAIKAANAYGHTL